MINVFIVPETFDMPGIKRFLKWMKDRTWNYDTEKTCLKVKYINDTGAASIKGTLVVASTSTDHAIEISASNEDMVIGAIAEDGVADGSEVFVVVSGSALVLLKDGTAATKGNWAESANVAGRADLTNAAPVPATHWQEIGHAVEDVGAGTDVLAEINMHFL